MTWRRGFGSGLSWGFRSNWKPNWVPTWCDLLDVFPTLRMPTARKSDHDSFGWSFCENLFFCPHLWKMKRSCWLNHTKVLVLLGAQQFMHFATLHFSSFFFKDQHHLCEISRLFPYLHLCIHWKNDRHLRPAHAEFMCAFLRGWTNNMHMSSVFV